MGESKKYKVIISDRAKGMLGVHIRFMAQVSKEAAKAKKEEIITAIRSLSQLPQRFPFFEEMYITPNKYHKMFIDKWYLVLYQIQDDTVYVDYILDCRKDYSWLQKN
ncbi:MAG: type II toxin-antitoxin system RelE/ParE family toxin [Lachnospiraceae bacterium]|nr:type II toxin-antitoxin system RelE/ParE family toxin [Lachnospiraceae bacterium]